MFLYENFIHRLYLEVGLDFLENNSDFLLHKNICGISEIHEYRKNSILLFENNLKLNNELLVEILPAIAAAAGRAVTSLGSAAARGALSLGRTAVSATKNIGSTAYSVGKTVVSKASELGGKAIQSVSSGLKNIASNIMSAGSKIFSKVKLKLGTLVKDQLKDTFRSMKSAVNDSEVDSFLDSLAATSNTTKMEEILNNGSLKSLTTLKDFLINDIFSFFDSKNRKDFKADFNNVGNVEKLIGLCSEENIGENFSEEESTYLVTLSSLLKIVLETLSNKIVEDSSENSDTKNSDEIDKVSDSFSASSGAVANKVNSRSL